MDRVSSPTRIYLFDNLKAVLILLVVFGHALESLLKSSEQAELLYLLIYSFHIPLFAFCSGYFASYHVTRIKRTLLYPFVVFQLLYLLFDRIYLNQDTPATFTKPYWLMWYLLALIVWEVALPFVEAAGARKQLVLLSALFLLGILVGYDKHIGYYLSLSRIAVYFPFFLMAHYMRVNGLYTEVRDFAKSGAGRILSLLAAVWMTACIIWQQDNFRVSWLYGSRSYEAGRYTALERIQFYLFAVMWISFLFGFLPDRKIRLSRIGQNSMYVYLLHGFLIKILEQEKAYRYVPKQWRIAAAFLASVILVTVLSGKWVTRLFGPLVRFPTDFLAKQDRNKHGIKVD